MGHVKGLALGLVGLFLPEEREDAVVIDAAYDGVDLTLDRFGST
jgi:hypothetical protein